MTPWKVHETMYVLNLKFRTSVDNVWRCSQQLQVIHPSTKDETLIIPSSINKRLYRPFTRVPCICASLNQGTTANIKPVNFLGKNEEFLIFLIIYKMSRKSGPAYTILILVLTISSIYNFKFLAFARKRQVG